jgi:hypothetical protein
MAKCKRWREIPTELSLERFRKFVLPHLSVGSRGPAAEAHLACALQLHSETAVPGMSVEETTHRKGRPRARRNRFCQGSHQNRPSEQYADKSGNRTVMISRARPDVRN